MVARSSAPYSTARHMLERQREGEEAYEKREAAVGLSRVCMAPGCWERNLRFATCKQSFG